MSMLPEKPWTPEEVERFCRENPAFLVVTAALVLQYLTSPVKKPAWLKDCPPVHGRRAGPWRGKGSFGSSFGPQVKHR